MLLLLLVLVVLLLLVVSIVLLLRRRDLGKLVALVVVPVFFRTSHGLLFVGFVGVPLSSSLRRVDAAHGSSLFQGT
jgi:hypothetical protein